MMTANSYTCEFVAHECAATDGAAACHAQVIGMVAPSLLPWSSVFPMIDRRFAYDLPMIPILGKAADRLGMVLCETANQRGSKPGREVAQAERERPLSRRGPSGPKTRMLPMRSIASSISFWNSTDRPSMPASGVFAPPSPRRNCQV